MSVLMLLPVLPQDGFHAVFHVEFPLFQSGFFELLVVGQVGLANELLQAILEFVVLGGEVMEFLVGLQQQCPKVLRLLIHGPPP
jgi:hypothetical protein